MYISEETKRKIRENIKILKKLQKNIKKAEGQKLDELLDEKNKLEEKNDNIRKQITEEYYNTIGEIREEFNKKVEKLEKNKKTEEIDKKIKQIKEKLNEKTNIAVKELASIGISVENIFPEIENEGKIEQKVIIQYFAKNNSYIVKNTKSSNTMWIRREELKMIDKKFLTNGLNISIKQFKNMNPNIIRILSEYDKNNDTNTLRDYKNIVTNIDNSKKQIKKEMEKANIIVEYNLDGIYDKIYLEDFDNKKEKYSIKEREEIFREASLDKKIGIANVNMNMKTKLMRIKEKILNGAKRNTTLEENKILKLNEMNQKNKQEKEMIVEINKKYEQKESNMNKRN